MSGSASLDHLGHVTTAMTSLRDESPADGESDGVVDSGGLGSAVTGAETPDGGGHLGSDGGGGGGGRVGSGGGGYPSYDEFGQPPQARLSPVVDGEGLGGGNTPLDPVS